MTEYDEAAERLRALAFWFGGRFVDGFEYPIAGTPCEAAIRNQRMVHIPERALALYPQAERIALPDPVSVASYLGIPLVGPDRRVMGHVAVVDVRPMPPDKRALALFEIFANRALAEMRRVRLEDELRARQDKLSRLIDGAMDAIVELDRELRITMVSAEGGYGQDEIAAMEALAPAIVQAFISKRAEERLRRGHEEYRHVVENSGSVILRMDKEMRVTFVNQYGLRFFGYRPEEIIGRRALGTIVPLREETGRDMAAMAEDILRTPERYRQNVHQNLRKDGSLVWMSWTNTPVYDDGGNLVELLSIGNDLSELKKAEAALRRTADQLQESETRYRTLVELAPDAVLVHQDRRILFANAEALRLYGASRLDQLLGRDILELVHPDDRASAAERVERAGRGGRTPVATFMRSFSPGFRELICHTNLGEDVPIEWANVRLREDVSISIGVDVRERQRAEEALRASEERYRTLFENMNEGFYLAEVICDASGKPTDFRYLEANAAFESLTGLSRKRVVGKTAREVLPGIEEGWVETYGRVALTGEPARLEQLPAPLERYYSTLAFSPHPRQFACVFQDVTERTKAAHERDKLLAEAESQRSLLDAVIDNLPVGIGIAEAPSGRLIRINEQTRRIWRLGSMEAADTGGYGKYVGFHPDGRPYEAEDWQLVRALRGEVIRGEELEFLAGDGTRHFMRSNAAPVKDRGGEVVAAVVVIDDITQRKLAEEGVRKANSQLADADRRKNDFLAVLSHELRNPLAPISNSLYILDHAPPGGEQARRATEVIGRQVAHLSSLVNDLLDVTRITRNKIQLQTERLELNEVVRRAVEDNRSFFERADVHLDLAPAPQPVPVIADRTRVVQIVGNLLQNAAKFTLKGGRVHVSVGAEGSAALVRVADDGVGMAAETLAGLFQPFMQADHTLDRSKGGLGLGLALVKGLVELHHGSVSAHSDGIGQGTEFVVRLPRDAGVDLEPATARTHRARTPRRILVIEDNVDAANSLREALELSDHDVVTAADGPEGLAKARMFQPEVVLCDIGLPGMDGFEVARAFRADEHLKGAFLVALSGYALPEDLQRAADAGFERHLAKPPCLEKLEQLIAEVPRTRGGSGTGGSAPPPA